LLAELATRTHVASFLHEAVSRQMARHAIHAAAIDQFDCQQKVATFLIELAFRTGVASAGRGVAFEMPLSRTDVADYLGLNTDTLSQHLSAQIIRRADAHRPEPRRGARFPRACDAVARRRAR
jgi:CRP/FNR family transcriptional regulator, anaerobic regulatory protein